MRIGIAIGIIVLTGAVLWAIQISPAFLEPVPAPEASSPRIASQGARQQAAELPRIYLKTALRDTPAPGQTIFVPADGDLQATLDNSRCGDIIRLAAGATYTGNFILPNHGDCAGKWIWLMTDPRTADLPPEGTRVQPVTAASFAKLITPNSRPALRTAEGANHYRLIALEVVIADRVAKNTNLITLGGERNPARLSHRIIVDRCYIHGHPSGDYRRGLAINAAWVAVLDSHISEFHERGADSQAIGGWSSPGPIKIVNNYLEGAAENILLGGAQVIPDMVFSDIEVSRNHFYKPWRWMAGHPEYAGIKWSVKNLFELKNARRVLVEGNLFENNWGGQGQGGDGILFSVRTSQTRGAVVEDITFRYNVLRNSGGGLRISAVDSNDPARDPTVRANRYAIHDNLFENIDEFRFNGTGRAFTLLDGPHDVRIEHNTVYKVTRSALTAGANPAVDRSRRFVFRNNIVENGRYGVKGDNRGQGLSTIRTYFPDSIFQGNLFVGGDCSVYPQDNFCPGSWEQVGFVDWQAGDYRLRPDSAFKKAANGADPGANVELLKAAESARHRSVPSPAS